VIKKFPSPTPAILGHSPPTPFGLFFKKVGIREVSADQDQPRPRKSLLTEEGKKGSLVVLIELDEVSS